MQSEGGRRKTGHLLTGTADSATINQELQDLHLNQFSCPTEKGHSCRVSLVERELGPRPEVAPLALSSMQRTAHHSNGLRRERAPPQ